MNTNRFLASLFAAMVTFGLLSAPALANKQVFFSVSGSVTAPPTGGEITVDGHTYHIQNGSSAEAQEADVQVGDSVELKLSGPPDSDSTEVVAIHATHGR